MDEQMMIKLNDIGQAIDILDERLLGNKISIDEKDLKLVLYIDGEFEVINIDELENDLKIIYLYTKANYMAILHRMSYINFEIVHEKSAIVNQYKDIDDFTFNNYELRITAYRKAISLSKISTILSNSFISQIYVNLANVYLEMGRIVESIEELKSVEDLVDNFPMAKANLAIKHVSLAERITDQSMIKFLLEKGLSELENTTVNATPNDIPLDILDQFHEWERYMENILDKSFFDVKSWSNESDVREDYKVWSAERNLTLNYINIIFKQGNVDDIQMINMGIAYFGNENSMEYYSWFNTIKQEYNMARYFLYKIDCLRNNSSVHESQRFNILINTLDYPEVGYRTELLKTSLKTAFSVLDKIGLFCCKFHNQKIPTHRVDFHKWYKEIELDVALRSPFNALYWLSKDLDLKKGEIRIIRQMRNCIEHRFLRVLEFYDTPLNEELTDNNKYEYKISYSDLENIAYETLRLVRRAIFYMANGFNAEYNRVYYGENKNGVFIPLLLDTYKDEWKN